MKIFVLTGPTAVGKTDLAIEWAQEHNTEILSCDSLCVYQSMNIGTAKPDIKQLALVPHHGIDLVPVDQQYSVKDFIDYARNTILDIHNRGKNVLISGGTGFYLKSFYAATVDEWPCDPKITHMVREWHAQHGLDWLLTELKKRNPSGLEDLDIHNPRRVMKALERCISTGHELKTLLTQFKHQAGPFDNYLKHTTLLMRNPLELSLRIQKRAELMVRGGLIDEVKQLLHIGIMRNPSAHTAIGYRETLTYLDQGGTIETLIQTIAQNTQKLVAKQLKWFRRQIPIDQRINLSECSNKKALESLFQGLM